ncbi:unnamed protein product, partial [Scytosiphon promiscuus]
LPLDVVPSPALIDFVHVHGESNFISSSSIRPAPISFTARRVALSRPKWNYDGSSTGQAPGEDSEVIIYPQAIYPDPFRAGDNI